MSLLVYGMQNNIVKGTITCGLAKSTTIIIIRYIFNIHQRLNKLCIFIRRIIIVIINECAKFHMIWFWFHMPVYSHNINLFIRLLCLLIFSVAFLQNISLLDQIVSLVLSFDSNFGSNLGVSAPFLLSLLIIQKKLSQIF